jgi:hypothetical protein
VPVLLLVVAVIVGCTGTALLLDAFRRVRRPDLGERLHPFMAPASVADEAQAWLDGQQSPERDGRARDGSCWPFGLA